ncbi:MAG: hypothetical protein AAFV95_29010 [Bacteroidota bacterium]
MTSTSTTIPLNTPEKTEKNHPFRRLDRVKRALFASPGDVPAPPPTPRKRKTKRGRKRMDLRPLPLNLGSIDPPTPKKKKADEEDRLQAEFLADSGDVREKYLLHSPDDVAGECNVNYLERLWELYFPCEQPRNLMEEAYQTLMRECIDKRLVELRAF